MSLAEIAGTPLGVKMGIPIGTKVIAPISTGVKTTLTPTAPILTKTGIQGGTMTLAFGPGTYATTTTIAPTQPQAPVTTQAKEGFTGSDLLGALSLTGKTALGSTPLGAGLNLIGSVWGLAGTLAGGTTKPVTVVEPKTSTTVNLLQNPLMKVVKAGAEQRQGAWYMQNPAVQRMLAVARTGATMSAVNKALPNYSNWMAANLAPVIYAKEVGDVAKLAEYQERQATTLLEPLAKGTVEGIVAKEYLQNTTNVYERIIERFYEYINQGGTPSPTPTPTDKGTDWGLIAIIGIVAIAGVLLLGSFIKRS